MTNLQKILQKILQNKRINQNDALKLLKDENFSYCGLLADKIRRQKHKNNTSYIVNRFINYSNICILACKFCSFAAKKNSAHSFSHSISQISEFAKQAVANGCSEIHIVGGLHPDLDKNFYLQMLKEIKKLSPSIHLKAFTAIEIRHLAQKIFKTSIKNLLEILAENGLDSLTGGGAEIFAPRVRKTICRGKETCQQWLQVHRLWHQLGKKSTCTMLFGHIETLFERVEHLRALRKLQDEYQGFSAFIPLPFIPQNTKLFQIKPISASEILHNLAMSRIFLDNFENITAYWVGMGLKLASLAQNYGVNDLHGTIEEEKIFHLAGANTPQKQSEEQLTNSIINAGFMPRKRNSIYKIID